MEHLPNLQINTLFQNTSQTIHFWLFFPHHVAEFGHYCAILEVTNITRNHGRREALNKYDRTAARKQKSEVVTTYCGIPSSNFTGR